METQLLDNSDRSIKFCADLINKGEVVGMPTETVYGLAGDALNSEAIKKIFVAKGRPQDNPLIVHIADFEMINSLVTKVPDLAKTLAERFWPGPLTMILPKKDIVPYTTSGGLDTVGIRMPSHEVARKLIRFSGKPIAAPSGNISGRPSPTHASHMMDDMNGKIPAIIDGGESKVGVESTVICFEKDGVRILRPGYITVDDLSQFTKVYVDNGVVHKLNENAKVMSPGMKYKHYSPKANVIIVEGELKEFCSYVNEKIADDVWCVVFDGEEKCVKLKCLTYGNTSQQQANKLFDVLRELDKVGAKTVYFRCPQKEGVGLAVYNRLLRAAGFEVVRV